MIDSHAHLDHERYQEDRDAVLRRTRAAGITGVLCIGIGDGPETMHRAFDLARTTNMSGDPAYPHLWASAGIYPHDTEHATAHALATLDHLLAQPEVIACGEIGLDYYHQGAPHPVQKTAFIAQMKLAAARRKPILIHCRPANGSDACWDDTLALLEEHWAPTGIGGILHCFSGNQEQALRAMDAGFYISFAGNSTYPAAGALREVAARIPADRILIETDAPFLAPVPRRGQRCEPAMVADTAAVLAQTRGEDIETFTAQTSNNFHRLFQLEGEL